MTDVSIPSIEERGPLAGCRVTGMCLAQKGHHRSLASATGIISAQDISEGERMVSTLCCPKPRLSVCDAIQLKGGWEADHVYQPVIAGEVLAASKTKVDLRPGLLSFSVMVPSKSVKKIILGRSSSVLG